LADHADSSTRAAGSGPSSRAGDAEARRRALLELTAAAPRGISELFAIYGSTGRAYTGLPGGGVFADGTSAPPPGGASAPSIEQQRQIERAAAEGVPIAWASDGDRETSEVLVAAPVHAQFTLRGVLAFFGTRSRTRLPEEDLEFVILAAMALGRAIETLEASRFTSYQRSLFEGLFRQTPDGIFLEDVRERRVLMVNDTLCRMLGYDRREVVGRRSDFLFADGDAGGEVSFGAVRSAAAGASLPEVELARSDGDVVPAEMVSTIIHDGRGHEIATMRHFRDVSARQQMEAMKQAFIAMASHELRTPLTAMIGSVTLLRESAEALSEDLSELVDLAFRSSTRLKRLVDDIIDIQRLEAGSLPLKRRLLSLGALVEAELKAHERSAATANVYLRFEPAADVDVEGDPDRLKQVLGHLLSNAIEHAPSGTIVSVQTERRAAWAVCAVRDAGSGIPDEVGDRVFDKFSRGESIARRRTTGAGLGLAISRAIVEAHGGSIDFSCPPAGGTLFTFRVPVAEGREGEEGAERWRRS
jgi:PAS domain S-box-containing protein